MLRSKSYLDAIRNVRRPHQHSVLQIMQESPTWLSKRKSECFGPGTPLVLVKYDQIGIKL